MYISLTLSPNRLTLRPPYGRKPHMCISGWERVFTSCTWVVQIDVYLNVMSWPHVKEKPQNLGFQACLLRLNFNLNA